ncbi:MAG: threonylcarbamoyl-AMP synthase [Desulfotalea sp.]|nr:MAG: threonylcarbamoyl-AMP synthase [Desulfotalea sp.]
MSRIGTSIDLAVEYLQQGQIVAFPTETYYGLGVDPTNVAAVARLFTLKKRPISKPLLLLISKIEQLASLTAFVPPEYLPLIEQYWPGPLTLIFPALASLNPKITAGTGTVGIRISPHPLAEKIVRGFGQAITATSANLSGMPPAQTAQEVKSMFGDQVDYILDGGSTAAGLCSTVIAIRGSQLEVIRRGEIDIFSS